MVNATVGIVGGGQLAQMTYLAGVSLGIDVVVLCPDGTEPAVRAGATHVAGVPERFDDLLDLARRCDVVTLDHERTPTHLLQRLSDAGYRVAPSAEAARVGRDKAAARVLAQAHGVPVAPWIVTGELEQVTSFGAVHGWPLHLKSTTGGYDGRGVWPVRSPAGVPEVMGQSRGPLLVEPTLRLEHEVSAVVVRSWSGQMVTYPLIETIQVDGACREAFVPAEVPQALRAQAGDVAAELAEAIGLVGVMAVELFVADGRLLLNELAVRPHNSGHLTIEACATSQFENHLRAVLDLPLGASELRTPAAAMANVMGGPDGADPFDRVVGALAVPGAAVHRYGKAPAPNRKLGHVTATGLDAHQARSIANRSAAALASRAAS